MKHILVVDDEPAVLLGVCNSLRGRRAEWAPTLAIDAEEACTRLDTAPDIDVLVCDLAMPGGGGVEVLRHALKMHPHVTRIVLSGKGRSEMAAEALPLCDRLLEKPCPPQVLHQTIQWAIDRSAASHQD